jgi:short subunit dehydrogenase-like uncharacterized protein
LEAALNPQGLIYGANGYTGELVAREAVRRGLRPILAGRHGASVEGLARELELERRVFPLDDPVRLDANLEGVGAVLHCAGPFVHTSGPMAEACLRRGVDYLDITGEIPVFESLYARDQEARARHVVLLPGVGFDVVPSDCLARRLHEAAPDADHLDLVLVNDGGSLSRGTLLTMIESLPHLGAVRLGGALVPVPIAHATRTVEFPIGRRLAVTIPWGDLAAAFRTTGIPNIRVFTGASPARLRRMRAVRPFLRLLALAPVKRLLAARVRRTVTGPSEAVRRAARVHLWGEAWSERGGRASAGLEVPEGYALTAATAAECLRRVLAGEVAPGAWTPAGAFGSALIDAIPGTQWRQTNGT